MLEFVILILKFGIVLLVAWIFIDYFLCNLIDHWFARKETYAMSIISKACIALGQTLQSAEQMKKSKE